MNDCICQTKLVRECTVTRNVVRKFTRIQINEIQFDRYQFGLLGIRDYRELGSRHIGSFVFQDLSCASLSMHAFLHPISMHV